jgi:hypothetical protein
VSNSSWVLGHQNWNKGKVLKEGLEEYRCTVPDEDIVSSELDLIREYMHGQSGNH